MTKIARHAWVEGRVQGVGFHWSAQEAAATRSVCGWAKNLFDGRVELHLEGEPEAVESMLRWLESGPSLARVDRLEVRAAEPEGSGGFAIHPSSAG